MLLIALIACRNPASSDKVELLDDTATDDSGGADSGTGEPLYTDRGCYDNGDPDPVLGEEYTLGDHKWRNVKVMTTLFDDFHATVLWPADGQTAWTDGAPVVLVVPDGFGTSDQVRDEPTPVFDAEFGVVEIHPIYPGWSVAGQGTVGSHDDGGLEASAAVYAAMTLAWDGEVLERFQKLSNVVGGPVCNARVGMLAVGNGSITAMVTVAASPELSDRMAGLALFEPPAVPQLITGDVGLVWMDPDPSTDGDGDGIAWNDARNTDWIPDTCDGISCDLDYSAVTWDAETRLSDVFPAQFSDTPQGLAYLDRQGNGVLDYGANGLDTDGDGVVGADEDFLVLGHVATDGITYFNPEVTLIASRSWTEWPDGVATLEQSESWWEVRRVIEEGKIFVGGAPSKIPVVVGFSEQDHALAITDRPGEHLSHDLFADAGFPVRYNPSAEAADCLVGDAWGGGPARGTDLSDAELHAYAIPEALDEQAAAISALGALMDGFGTFDHCPGRDR